MLTTVSRKNYYDKRLSLIIIIIFIISCGECISSVQCGASGVPRSLTEHKKKMLQAVHNDAFSWP